jgi:hypothetical protein
MLSHSALECYAGRAYILFMSPRKSIARHSKFFLGSSAVTASRTPKSILPPIDLPAGGPDRPVLVRVVKLRYAANSNAANGKTTRTRASGPAGWRSMEITIPREIAEVTGIEAGMTMCVEGYVDGRVRIFPAGDLLSRDDTTV